jgi:hypothetical protein
MPVPQPKSRDLLYMFSPRVSIRSQEKIKPQTMRPTCRRFINAKHPSVSIVQVLPSMLEATSHAEMCICPLEHISLVAKTYTVSFQSTLYLPAYVVAMLLSFSCRPYYCLYYLCVGLLDCRGGHWPNHSPGQAPEVAEAEVAELVVLESSASAS